MFVTLLILIIKESDEIMSCLLLITG